MNRILSESVVLHLEHLLCTPYYRDSERMGQIRVRREDQARKSCFIAALNVHNNGAQVRWKHSSGRIYTFHSNIISPTTQSQLVKSSHKSLTRILVSASIHLHLTSTNN
ncbi:hypothetical protein KIN20_010624 [Parelaphostrongylus tenuis]|uniref:Uncharacterized protein n=1 Tax=Parelaphostrongylus tenuis TaxID=148309 RepID=A0AAD5QLH6_PARTN|nr:hypothetical protein KIN20_010624 [Parelaphostrongylus tenuis]